MPRFSYKPFHTSPPFSASYNSPIITLHSIPTNGHQKDTFPSSSSFSDTKSIQIKNPGKPQRDPRDLVLKSQRKIAACGQIPAPISPHFHLFSPSFRQPLQTPGCIGWTGRRKLPKIKILELSSYTGSKLCCKCWYSIFSPFPDLCLGRM